MSKQKEKFVDAEYEEVRNGHQIGGDQPETIQFPKRNLAHKVAGAFESLGTRIDDMREARAAKKAAKLNMTEEERKEKRAATIRKVVIGGALAAGALAVASLGVKKLAGDGPMVAYDFTPEPEIPEPDDADEPATEEELDDDDIAIDDPADIDVDTI